MELGQNLTPRGSKFNPPPPYFWKILTLGQNLTHLWTGLQKIKPRKSFPVAAVSGFRQLFSENLKIISSQLETFIPAFGCSNFLAVFIVFWPVDARQDDPPPHWVPVAPAFYADFWTPAAVIKEKGWLQFFNTFIICLTLPGCFKISEMWKMRVETARIPLTTAAGSQTAKRPPAGNPWGGFLWGWRSASVFG